MAMQGKVPKTTLKLIIAQIDDRCCSECCPLGATHEGVSRVDRKKSISYNRGVSMFCAPAGPPNFIANQHKKPHLLQSRPMRLVIEANPVSVIRGGGSIADSSTRSFQHVRDRCVSQLLSGFLLRVVT